MLVHRRVFSSIYSPVPIYTPVDCSQPLYFLRVRRVRELPASEASAEREGVGWGEGKEVERDKVD